MMGALVLLFSLNGLADAWTEYRTAHQVSVLTAASLPLTSSMQAVRLARGATLGALRAADPVSTLVSQRIAESRRAAAANLEAAIKQLNMLAIPGLRPLVDRLLATSTAVTNANDQIDAVLQRPRTERPGDMIDTVNTRLGGVLADYGAVVGALEHSLQTGDPLVGQWIPLKHIIWEMRGALGQSMVELEGALAGATTPTPEFLMKECQLEGNIATAMTLLLNATTDADLPKPLRDAVVTVSQKYTVFRDGVYNGALAGLASGQNRVSAMDMVASGLEAVRPMDELIELTMRSLQASAKAQEHRATRGLLLNGVALLVVLLSTGGGVLLATRRISGPICDITSTMLRLAQREMTVPIPGLDRHDEIGAMARAVVVFRDEMIRCDQLDALEEAHAMADAERAAQDAERALFINRQTQAVEALAHGLAELAEGNLTFALAPGFPADYELLRRDFNAAVAVVCATVEDILRHAEIIGSGTAEINEAADTLWTHTEQNANKLDEAVGALHTLSLACAEAVSVGQSVKELSARTCHDTHSSDHVVTEAVAAMNELAGSSEQIGEMTGVIDEIAFQTNLLALNAGVEAARAGEAGLGFAVVATEVRALAQRAADAAKQIKTLASTSVSQVERGVRLVGETGAVLGRIQAGVTAMDEALARMNAAAKQQADDVALITESVQHLNDMTQQNTVMVEQSTEATRSLKQETAALNHAVARFRIVADAKAA